MSQRKVEKIEIKIFYMVELQRLSCLKNLREEANCSLFLIFLISLNVFRPTFRYDFPI